MYSQHGTDSQSHANVYGVLKGTNLFCYHQQQDMDANVDPAITIGINKVSQDALSFIQEPNA